MDDHKPPDQGIPRGHDPTDRDLDPRSTERQVVHSARWSMQTVDHFSASEGIEIGLSCPTWIEFTAIQTSPHGSVALDGRYELAGHYRLVRLEMTGRSRDDDDPQELTPAMVQAVRIGDLARPIALDVIRSMRVTTLDGGDRMAEALPTGEGLSDEEATVLAHMRAQLFGLDTNAYIAWELGIAKGTATQRVHRLRKRGLIPPTTPRSRRP